MNGIILSYQFREPDPIRKGDLVNLLKQEFGGAVSFIASDTIFIDSNQPADMIFDLVAPLFTFDDKLFVGEIKDFKSLHHVSRTRPMLRRVAI